MKAKSATLYAIAGLTLQLAVVVALVFAVSGMLATFDTIGASGDRAEAAHAIARQLERVKIATSAGAVLGLGGLGLLAVGVARGARQRWVFGSSVAALLVWLPLFPVGSLVGATGLVLLVTQREKFGRKEEPNSESSVVATPTTRLMLNKPGTGP